MKKYILIILLGFNISVTFSQKWQGFVEYQMEFYGPPSLKTTLYFTDTESTFTSNKFYSTEDRIYRESNIFVMVEGDTIGKVVYKNLVTKHITSRKFIRNMAFVIEDSLSEIDWVLSENIKEIGGYKCQKAITNFKGREYEVWFTPDIPISTGPWKLWGLPGLILEGRDKTGQVVFHFSKLNLGYINTLKAKFPYNSERPWLLGKSVNNVNFISLKRKDNKKIRQEAQSLTLEGGATISNVETQWIEKEEGDEEN